ncbi:hypothetical protein MesoLj113c_21410 [Mesorhizobium sp. 113-3-9]|nr:hypothetical protein MesoLj113c_21410 [Mesorhizobium sp. 113-3-9]
MCDPPAAGFRDSRLYLDPKRKEWVGSAANAARCIGEGRCGNEQASAAGAAGRANQRTLAPMEDARRHRA